GPHDTARDREHHAHDRPLHHFHARLLADQAHYRSHVRVSIKYRPADRRHRRAAGSWGLMQCDYVGQFVLFPTHFPIEFKPELICVLSCVHRIAPASANTTPTIDHSTISIPASSRTRRTIALPSIAFSIFVSGPTSCRSCVLGGAARHHIGRFCRRSVSVGALPVTTGSHRWTLFVRTPGPLKRDLALSLESDSTL